MPWSSSHSISLSSDECRGEFWIDPCAEQKFSVSVFRARQKNGIDLIAALERYSLIFHTVHCFPLAPDPSAVSLTVKRNTKVKNVWVKMEFSSGWRCKHQSLPSISIPVPCCAVPVCVSDRVPPPTMWKSFPFQWPSSVAAFPVHFSPLLWYSVHLSDFPNR